MKTGFPRKLLIPLPKCKKCGSNLERSGIREGFLRLEGLYCPVCELGRVCIVKK